MIQKHSFRYVLVFSSIFLIHLIAFVLIKDHGLMMDEHHNYRQIMRFATGDFRIDPDLTVVPGYHLFMSVFPRLFGVDWEMYYLYVPLARGTSLFFSLATVPLFYAAARRLDQQSALIKTLQYSVFPLLSVYFFLIYTDAFSILFIILTLLFLLKHRYPASGLAASVSVMIRQNNIVWLIFFCLLAYLHRWGNRVDRHTITEHMKRTSTYGIGILFFVVFLILNKGLVAGSQSRQYVQFTLTKPQDVFLALFLYSVLFLPSIVPALKGSIRTVWKYKYWAMLAPLAYPLYYVYMVNDHPMNQGTFFLHNLWAVVFSANPVMKFLLFVINLCAVVALLSVRMYRSYYYLLYPFAILFLWPIGFIEHRYTIIPFTLYLLFRKTGSTTSEMVQLFFFFILSVYFYFGMFTWRFFP